MNSRRLQQFASRFGVHGLRPALRSIFLAGSFVACAGGGSTSPGASAPQIEYSGPATWTITGPVGGPFSNTPLDFVLANTGADPVSWSTTSVPSFVLVNPEGGVIPPSSTTTVHAELDDVLAASLPAGDTEGVLRFHNETSQQADIAIDCSLSITNPVARTELQPLDDFASTGPAGGPFLPSQAVYQLADTGPASVHWQAIQGDPWVSVWPASGALAPNDSVDVMIGIEASATCAFLGGMHSSYVDFVDAATNTTLHSREVTVNVTSGGTNSEGWTQFTPSKDTRRVFVSSSGGNDSNDGLSEAHAKRTIAAGKALMRDGYPDWLLLKCGDTWDEPIGTWPNSGRSIAEPTLIGSYGSGARPFLRTGVSEALVPAYGSNPNFVSVVGLHFKAHLYDGTNGAPTAVNWIRHTTGFLLEDCCIERYATNLVIQGFNETNGNQTDNRHTNVRIRRNVISEAYNRVNSGNSPAMSSSGIFVSNCDGVLIEENLFDHNGTVDSIPGAIPIWFRHNGYVTNGNTGVILRGNIVYGTDGVMMRSGGVVENNLYLRNYNAILFGLGIEPEPAGVTGVVRRNVVLDGRDYGDGAGNPVPGGLGINMGNLVHVSVLENIFAHNTSGTGPRPLQLHDSHEYGNYRVAVDTTLSGNIVFDWGGTSLEIRTADGGNSQQPVNLHLSRNIFDNARDPNPLVQHTISASLGGVSSDHNKFFSVAPDDKWFRVGGSFESLAQWKEQVHDTTSVAGRAQFPAPNRTIATYQASIGGTPSLEAFLTEARLQSKSNWRPQYTAAAVNDYVRAGFGL